MSKFDTKFDTKNTVLEFVMLQTLVQKKKPLSLGPKMTELDIFGLEFKNIFVIFEISTLEFVYLQNFG